MFFRSYKTAILQKWSSRFLFNVYVFLSFSLGISFTSLLSWGGGCPLFPKKNSKLGVKVNI